MELREQLARRYMCREGDRYDEALYEVDAFLRDLAACEVPNLARSLYEAMSEAELTA